MSVDSEVTIHIPGHEPIHTTTEAMRRATDRLPSQEAQRRSTCRLRESMEDTAEFVRGMAKDGLISDEAAADHARLAQAVADKLAPEQPATRFAKDQLKAIIERIERLEEEKKTISDDIKDVYAEAKGNGFDTKALRTIVRMRKQDPNERAEQETILETYMQALGML